MFWNQVEIDKIKIKKNKKEKEKKVEKERARERKREGGSRIKWRVEKKKERMEIYGYTCVVEKK